MPGVVGNLNCRPTRLDTSARYRRAGTPSAVAPQAGPRARLRRITPVLVPGHRGRIVKNTGDGFLAEFQSVVDAVRCAVEAQRGMIDHEPEVPEERRIRFRIGVNL